MIRTDAVLLARIPGEIIEVRHPAPFVFDVRTAPPEAPKPAAGA